MSMHTCTICFYKFNSIKIKIKFCKFFIFQFFVVAKDQGEPPRVTPLQITIEITDKDDNNPEFKTVVS